METENLYALFCRLKVKKLILKIIKYYYMDKNDIYITIFYLRLFFLSRKMKSTVKKHAKEIRQARIPVNVKIFNIPFIS